MSYQLFVKTKRGKDNIGCFKIINAISENILLTNYFFLGYTKLTRGSIDIQKREDANRCSSYVELVVLNYNFNEFRQHLKPFYKLEVNKHFRTGSGSCFINEYQWCHAELYRTV
jgi:hypothetical protein